MMSKDTFLKITAGIEAVWFQRDCLQRICKDFPHTPRDTLLSIYSQYYQLQTKRSHGSHRRESKMDEYYHKYQYMSALGSDGSTTELLLCLSQEVHLAPTLFARIILEQCALKNQLLHHPNTGASYSAVVSSWMKHPSSIPDKKLQAQVKHCILNDTHYGPMAENLKHSVGYQYEYLLQEKLEELGIPFLGEKDLREKGYDKTPDFKLEVPFAVDGFIVNWIESKASFGDEESHGRYLEEQYWSYQNRFGSGLVVYWFGYIAELDCKRGAGIMLTESFPNRPSITLLHV